MTRIVFMGTPDFSVPVLQKVIEEGYEVVGVVTQPDRPVGRKKVLTPPPVKVEALKQGIEVFQPEKIKMGTSLEPILALKPDLIITAAYGQILPKDLLDAPKFGCINVHASLLPELRGGAPIHYAIIQGKEKTGITIMYMAEKLDAGDILTQAEIAIEEKDTVGLLHDKLSVLGANLLAETLPKLLNGELTPIKQNEEDATYAANITREQEKIHWSMPGEAIYNLIRGLNPWPVAYTKLNGSVIKLWQSEKVISHQNEAPGTILAIDDDGIIVSSGNQTSIKIIELQPAGKKKMFTGQFLRGAGSQIQVGDRFGDSQ